MNNYTQFHDIESGVKADQAIDVVEFPLVQPSALQNTSLQFEDEFLPGQLPEETITAAERSSEAKRYGKIENFDNEPYSD